jgi:hypothetical protein
VCDRRVARRRGARARRSVPVNPIPNPDPHPNKAPQMSLKEARSLDRCALNGKPVCGGGICVGGGGRAVYYYVRIY